MSAPFTAPRKAAIYLRISQDREMDGLAIDRQRERCEELAQYRRWDVVEAVAPLIAAKAWEEGYIEGSRGRMWDSINPHQTRAQPIHLLEGCPEDAS